jgi:hypothetical protein
MQIIGLFFDKSFRLQFLPCQQFAAASKNDASSNRGARADVRRRLQGCSRRWNQGAGVLVLRVSVRIANAGSKRQCCIDYVLPDDTVKAPGLELASTGGEPKLAENRMIVMAITLGAVIPAWNKGRGLYQRARKWSRWL